MGLHSCYPSHVFPDDRTKEDASSGTTTISLQEAEGRSPRSAAKKLCDFGEVAEHLWASVSHLMNQMTSKAPLQFHVIA